LKIGIKFLVGFFVLILLSLTINLAMAAELEVVRVSGFPNAKVLPIYIGINTGIFEKNGIKVELNLTESSSQQRQDLASARIDVVHSALDNALAMIEVAKKDVVIVSGGDGGMNEFFVQPDIQKFEDLKGKTIIVDAVDTAYALQAKKILLRYGLLEGRDYLVKPAGAILYRYKALIENKNNSAAILNLPFNVQAQELGLRSLGRLVDLLGPYQAVGAFVMRNWANEKPDLLKRYLKAYIESLRWIRDPLNKEYCVSVLKSKLNLSDFAANRTYDLLNESGFGFNLDAKLDDQGFRNMLDLRQEIQASGSRKSFSIDSYVDLSFYNKAISELK
jgi:ABC-type nitrate/sulfonate/bicarbonate transport system substrate-binding protein